MSPRPCGLLRTFVLLALVGWLLAPVAARAVCPDESGIGGTGLTRDEESGIGGTGHSGDEEESGLGGTGHGDDDDSGLGGTGLLGTITAHGSVCVNGFTVQYDDRTPVEENGVASDAHELSVGSLVVVDAALDAGQLRASRIAVRDAAVGPVTKLDATARTVEVVGQTVEIVDGALLVDRVAGGRPAPIESFTPGSFVAVSGLRAADGRIVATRLERRPPQEEVSVTGHLSRGDGGGASVGGASVELALPAQDSGPLGSEPVLVRGRWNAIAGRIEGARTERAYPIDRTAARVSVEGYVQEIDAEGRARVEGLPVRIETGARVESGLRRGDRVLVGGRFDRDGQLRATEVRKDAEWRDHVARAARDRTQEAGARSREDRQRSELRDRSERGREDVELDREDREAREDRVRSGGGDDRSEREDREVPDKPEHDN